VFQFHLKAINDLVFLSILDLLVDRLFGLYFVNICLILSVKLMCFTGLCLILVPIGLVLQCLIQIGDAVLRVLVGHSANEELIRNPIWEV